MTRTEESMIIAKATNSILQRTEDMVKAWVPKTLTYINGFGRPVNFYVAEVYERGRVAHWAGEMPYDIWITQALLDMMKYQTAGVTFIIGHFEGNDKIKNNDVIYLRHFMEYKDFITHINDRNRRS